VILLTVGLLVLAHQDTYVARLLSPGPVSLHHGEIGACGSCHEAFERGPGAWIPAAFSPSDPLADSKKCLACHDLGQHAFRAHSLAPARVDEMARMIAARETAAPRPAGLTAARALFGTSMHADGELGCAGCHKEHRGQRFDQTQMTDDRCQSCHSLQFTSFSDGHPRFEGYPFTRRTRINFDHLSHIRRHFEKAGPEKVPETCTDCHSPALDGRLMLVDNFAKTCAACHLDQIEGVDRVGPKGVPFLVVPGLDLVELRERGAAIGEWPEWSEENLTPFMKVLLAEDASLMADVERLESLDLLDLSDSDDEDIVAIERLAWRVKELIFRLIASGVEDMADPLSGALGQTLDRVAVGRLFGVIPADVVRSTQSAWFPNLAAELARHRRGEPVPIPGGDDIGVMGSAPTDGDGAEDAETRDDDDILSGDESDILSEEEEGDILSEEEEADILSEEEEGDILSEDEGDILSDEDILSEEDILSDEDAPEVAAEAEDPGQVAATLPEPDAEQWAALGGWYRRDFVLYYKPLGHADRFVRAWLDVSGPTFETPHQALGAPLFTMLADQRSPGRCTKCHSVDREADGAMNVKWKPRQPQRGLQTATVFVHATHFSMRHEKGCLTCHGMAPAADYADGYKDNDPYTFASNFQPIELTTCAACHVAERASESCLLCHQYHVGAIATQPVLTQMK
jgi:hypothetical protein